MSENARTIEYARLHVHPNHPDRDSAILRIVPTGDTEQHAFRFYKEESDFLNDLWGALREQAEKWGGWSPFEQGTPATSLDVLDNALRVEDAKFEPGKSGILRIRAFMPPDDHIRYCFCFRFEKEQSNFLNSLWREIRGQLDNWKKE